MKGKSQRTFLLDSVLALSSPGPEAAARFLALFFVVGAAWILACAEIRVDRLGADASAEPVVFMMGIDGGD